LSNRVRLLVAALLNGSPVTMSPLRISYQTECFPAGSIANGLAHLDTSWDDVLWAAVTVGRPNRHYVFRHGDASIYEAIFRWSLIRMSLEQSGPGSRRLRSTSAARTLDTTEKGWVSYFIGMTFCKLFAARLLNTPWLLHLDVFRQYLNLVLNGRSRPDLVGKEHGTGIWHAFECKGRISPPNDAVKQKAKNQADRLVSVHGTVCSLHIGAITYLRGDVLQFYWRDPVPEKAKPIEIPFSGSHWRYYYAPVTQLITANQDYQKRMQSESGVFLPVADLDLEVGIHPLVAVPLFHGQWEQAHQMALRSTDTLARAGYQPDGLAVRAGASWSRQFEDLYFSEG